MRKVLSKEFGDCSILEQDCLLMDGIKSFTGKLGEEQRTRDALQFKRKWGDAKRITNEIVIASEELDNADLPFHLKRSLGTKKHLTRDNLEVLIGLVQQANPFTTCFSIDVRDAHVL